MCRLYGFRATHPTKVECTLVHAQNALLSQSRLDRSGGSHADGWGIVAYEGGVPYRERQAKAAHADIRFSSVAERLDTHTALAHVRRATIGGPSVENTHPFVHGRWAFAHNGTVTGFDVVGTQMAAEIDSRLLAQRNGETDSELLFLWLLSHMELAGVDLEERIYSVGRIREVLATSISLLASRCEVAGGREPASLNVLLTDGSILVGARWHRPLYWLTRRGGGVCEVCDCGHVRQNDEGAQQYRAVVVASEPISGESWEEAPDECILTVDGELELTLDAL